MAKRNRHIGFLFFCLAILLSVQNCFAGILSDWKDTNAYRPNPVLFLHGFAAGNPTDWGNAGSSLSKYFAAYSNSYSYLETIDFQDPNGSIDTYGSGKLNPQGNSKGWSDKVDDKINELLSTTKYGNYTTKLNLVCHSMGGLAARWYLEHYTSSYVDKLILIGVPNSGSPLTSQANALSKIPKLGWSSTLVSVNSVMSFIRDNIDLYTSVFKIDINGEATDDLDDSAGGSGFLSKVNNIGQPGNVNYFGIIGVVGNLANWFLFEDWYGGDSIASKNSQLGTASVSYKQISQIPTVHWNEPKIAANVNWPKPETNVTGNKILQFLDSTPPEFTLDNPQTNSTTEINTNSISIQGKVYKEYLPADSKIIISGVRQEDGAVLNQINSSLKPSSLWIPNNLDSPVAEFNETIAFLGQGTYQISCQIKNPAGLTSDTKVFWIKVTVQSNANIIVHCHNPEGKEIDSIPGLGNAVGGVEIYDGDTLIGYGAYDANTHGKPISIPSGNHTIKTKFNGMVLEQNIDIIGETTQTLTFAFTRTEFDLHGLINSLSPIPRTSGGGEYQNPCNIPSYNNFNNWLCQTTQYYPIPSLGTGGGLYCSLYYQAYGGYEVIQEHQSQGYVVVGIPANRAFVSIDLGWRYDGGFNLIQTNLVSVPYDILGTAV